MIYIRRYVQIFDESFFRTVDDTLMEVKELLGNERLKSWNCRGFFSIYSYPVRILPMTEPGVYRLAGILNCITQATVRKTLNSLVSNNPRPRRVYRTQTAWNVIATLNQAKSLPGLDLNKLPQIKLLIKHYKCNRIQRRFQPLDDSDFFRGSRYSSGALQLCNEPQCHLSVIGAYLGVRYTFWTVEQEVAYIDQCIWNPVYCSHCGTQNIHPTVGQPDCEDYKWIVERIRSKHRGRGKIEAQVEANSRRTRAKA
jgi:hypothetical protein